MPHLIFGREICHSFWTLIIQVLDFPPRLFSCVELQTNIYELWGAYSSCLHPPLRVKSRALPPAFKSAAARCGIDHSMLDPSDLLLDSSMREWGHWTFIWPWHPGYFSSLPRWLLHYRDHLPLFSPLFTWKVFCWRGGWIPLAGGCDACSVSVLPKTQSDKLYEIHQ